MNNLPLEAFKSIIKLLDKETQSNCARVSKPWNRNMKHAHILGQKVNYYNIKGNEEIIQFFESNKYLEVSSKRSNLQCQGSLAI